MAENLSDFIQHELYPRLNAEQVYDWAGHKWQRNPAKWHGACPWHESKSGTAFVVSLPSLLWFCAGCQVGGGPLEYLWRRQGGQGPLRGEDFLRLARELAQSAGVTFPECDLSPEEIKQAELRASRAAALNLIYRLCAEHLWTPAGDTARAYLQGRGLSDEAIHDLELGFYEDVNAMRLLVHQAGYASDANEGIWNRLLGYIVFPWRDEYGRPLTLYGRWPAQVPPEGKPKTIGQPNAGLDSSKGVPLYYDRARKAGHKSIVLVEGVLDAAVLQSLGQTDVVAYVGAAPSAEQFLTLARHQVTSATICPDPDAAGDSGVKSFLSRMDPSIRAYVAPRLPDGQDPDEFILKFGVSAWKVHIAKAVPGWEYLTTKILDGRDLGSPRERDMVIGELIALAGNLTRYQDLAELTKLAAKQLNVTLGAIRKDFDTAYAERVKRQVAEAKEATEKARPAPAPEPPPEPRTLQQVLDTYRRWLFLKDTGDIEVVLAAVVANRSPGDPVWLLVVAPPGTGKTEVIMPLAALPDVHLASTLTEASLLSGTAAKEVAEDATGGLLRQVGDQGIILIKDMSGLLSLNRDTRGPVLSALREIYDGQWARPVGTDGGRVLEWRGKCGLVAGATPAIDGFHATIAALGERFTFYRLPETARNQRTTRALDNVSQESAMRAELTAAVAGFFVALPPASVIQPLTKRERTWLVLISDLIVRARSGVERDLYAQARPIVNVWGAEMPTRFVKVLAQMRLALLRIGVTPERMWDLLLKIAWDSTPKMRRQCLDYLARQEQGQTIKKIAQAMDSPATSVSRTLEELLCYHLVVHRSVEGADVWAMAPKARKQYRWCQKPETREGVLPLKKESSFFTPSLKNGNPIQSELRVLEPPPGTLPDDYTGRATWTKCGLEVTVLGLAEAIAGKRFFRVAESQAAICEDDLKVVGDA